MARKTAAGVESWLNQGVDLDRRILRIHGAIEEDLAERVLSSAVLLVEKPDPITVYLNTTGGDVDYGMAIYDVLRACDGEVHIHVWGCAWSMGSIILQAGDKRTLAPHASVLIHHGTLGYKGHAASVKRQAAFDMVHHKKVDSILFEKMRAVDPKLTWRKFQTMLVADTIFSAEAAVEAGLADAVLNPDIE